MYQNYANVLLWEHLKWVFSVFLTFPFISSCSLRHKLTTFNCIAELYHPLHHPTDRRVTNNMNHLLLMHSCFPSQFLASVVGLNLCLYHYIWTIALQYSSTYFLIKSSVSPYDDFFFSYPPYISTGSNFLIMVGQRCSVKYSWCLFVLENVMLRSGGLKLVVKAHVECKIKTVDAATLCFMNAIYYVWSKDYERRDSCYVDALACYAE